MQLKQSLYLGFSFFSFFLWVSCGQKIKRLPSNTYMPDMYYSRAYETYASTAYLNDSGIHFTASPVVGTVARDVMIPSYDLPNDAKGYAESAKVLSPIKEDLNEADFKKTERLFLVNCAICHGAQLNGNGPLYKGGEGPFAAKPATLVGDPIYEAMSEGTMFHSVKYGKNLMGSYASQLSEKECWMIVKYIKMKQAKK